MRLLLLIQNLTRFIPLELSMLDILAHIGVSIIDTLILRANQTFQKSTFYTY
jgi:hypothetical protein